MYIRIPIFAQFKSAYKDKSTVTLYDTFCVVYTGFVFELLLHALVICQELETSVEKVDDWQFDQTEQDQVIENRHQFTINQAPSYTNHKHNINNDNSSGFNFDLWILLFSYTILIMLAVGLIVIHRKELSKIQIISLLCASKTANDHDKHTVGHDNEIGNDVSNKRYYSNITLKRALQILWAITSVTMVAVMFFCVHYKTNSSTKKLPKPVIYDQKPQIWRNNNQYMKSSNDRLQAESITMSNDKTIGLLVGDAKDINNFRQNIKNGYLPQKSDVTIEGIFYDYFDTSENEDSNGNANITPCSYLFCPSYSQGMWFCFSIVCYACFFS